MTTLHPTAIVDAQAELGPDVAVGPYCVIGPHVRVGAGTHLMSHVVLDGRTTIGAKCRLFPFACIGTETQDKKFRGGPTFVEIGDETTIREYVTVNSGTNEGEITRVGSRCLLMACSHVAHACRLGDDVILANAAMLAGEVIVEDQAVIGGMTGIHQFVRVGRLCIVGGGSRISQDCPPFMMVVGATPQVHGLNSVGLERRQVSSEVRDLLKTCYKVLYRQGLATGQALAKIRAEVRMAPEVEHLVRFIETSERGITK